MRGGSSSRVKPWPLWIHDEGEALILHPKAIPKASRMAEIKREKKREREKERRRVITFTRAFVLERKYIYGTNE